MSDRRPTAEEIQAEIFRRMTPEQRLQCCFRRTEFTYELARAGNRSQHPDWTSEQIDREIGRRITDIDVEELKREFASRNAFADRVPE